MAKRFIDTGLFDDEWFMNLCPEAKILWLYFITKCDHAGILKLNQTLAKVQTGIKDLNKVIEQLGNRLVTVSESVFFVPKFLEFQYPDFPKSKVRQQASAIEILQKYNLIDNEGNIKYQSNSMLRVSKELTNSYDNEHDNDTGIEKGLSREKQKSMDSRETIFVSEVWQYGEQYPDDMLKQFIAYWTEKNKSKTRMRFETEKTFEVNKRLVTWANRSKDYGAKKDVGADPYELAKLEASKLGIQQ